MNNIIYQQRINTVINYINSDLSKSFSLDELAKIAHFSSFHFHRIFLAITGESVNFYTNRVRLEKSARQLKLSSISLKDIAMDCGFSSPATFSRSFKNYFGITPSDYRNGEQLENSKICKELFPYKEYLVPMSAEELQTNFPIAIKTLPKRQVAYIRVVDAYRENVVNEAFAKLIVWAKQNKLFDHQTIFGMSIDDPMTTPKEKYRYEACITLPDGFDARNTNIEVMTMPECAYATTSVSGNLNMVATATDYLFNNWLINSDYEPEHQHGLEIFLDKESIADWSHFNLELCIPIKKLKTYS